MIFIDPGYGKTNKCAYAGFGDKVLKWVHFSRPFDLSKGWSRGMLPIYYELPEQRGYRSTVKMSTLIMLAAVAGQAAGPYGTPVKVSTWKASASKEAMHRRARTKVLSPEENAIIDAFDIDDDLRHNIMDAVCGGLVMLKRM